MRHYEEVTIDTLNQGAVKELFDEGFKRVMANIADLNTDAVKTRSLTIKVEIKPEKTREGATTKVSVSTSLAPVKPHESFIVLDGDGVGSCTAFTTNAKQLELTESEEIHATR